MSAAGEYTLTIKDVCKSFSGVQVLDRVNLTLRKGQILGLVGENGAGKSTLMNILGGVLPKDSGAIFLDGEEYTPQNPKHARRRGIAFIHQELSLFTNLSVMENVLIDEFPNVLGVINYRKMTESVAELLAEISPEIKPNTKVEELKMGSRQLVEITKALVQNARIIIFDEPTTSLSHREKQKLFTIINDLSAKGVSIIFISHVLDDVFQLCDEVIVLRDGISAGQTPIQNTCRDDVIRMMVGRELNNLYPYVEKEIGQPVLTVNNLCSGKTFSQIDFELRQGEILGIFGLMGSGRTEVCRAIFGLDKFDDGTITLNGKTYNKMSPKKSIADKMAFVTENRREEGLLMPKSIKENIVLAALNLISEKLNWVNKKKENSLANDMVDALSIKSNKNTQPVIELSGGNQQKVVIGKWLMTKPDVFILDEPTRGVDVGAKFDIYNHINDLALAGSAVIFVSSEMEELFGVVDRILVMNKGKFRGELTRDSFCDEALIKLALEA